MIRFFRKIRYDLMEKNKTGKYLLYAIGEILLVVIGILIAISINNWNENQKNNNEETAILKSLYENLILAKTQSESLIIGERELRNTLVNVLGIQSNNTDVNRTSLTDSIFAKAIWTMVTDVPVINSYTNLKNTGRLDLIKSQEIKEKFTSLEINQTGLIDILKDRLDVHQIRIDDIAENDLNFVRLIKTQIPTVNIENELQNDYNQILKNQRLRNLLGIKLMLTHNALRERENFNKDIIELKLLIETELNKKK